MTFLWITKTNPSKPRTLRAIRKALELMGASSTLDEAFRVWREVDEEGEALLGAASREDAERAIGALAADDCEGRIETEESGESPEEVFAGKLTDEPQASGEALTILPAQLALILMYGTDGNPTLALQVARGIGRLTDDSVWNRVEDALIETFPPHRVR